MRPEKLIGEITVAELIEWLKECDQSFKIAVPDTYSDSLTTDIELQVNDEAKWVIIG